MNELNWGAPKLGLVFAAFLVSACTGGNTTSNSASPSSSQKSSPGSSAGEKSSAAPNASGDAANGHKCASGQFGGGDIPFCMTMPSGYSITEPASSPDNWSRAVIGKDKGASITLKWTDGRHLELPHTVDLYFGDDRKPPSKGVSEGDVAGGKGKFLTATQADDTILETVLISSGDKPALIRCNARWPTATPAPEAGDACKGITTF